jgi:hypothetical protein
MPSDNDSIVLTMDMRDILVERILGTNRRMRQDAAHMLAQASHGDIDYIVDVSDVLVDSLSLPEAQTRWECLDMLSDIALVCPKKVLDAFPGAEDALFDDSSASVRLSAFRFMCRYGTISPDCADRAWPLINEAIQCYHGDPEYREMLVSLKGFAQGDLGDEVRDALVERMSYDAKNSRGFIRAYSADICALVKERA